jgi:GTP-binding protein
MIDSEVLSLRKQGLPIVAIVGRPNVGKSTLFNRLVRKRRAITDSMPGVTRDLIPEKWLLGNHAVLLVDSGGVRLDQEGIDFIVTQKSLSLLDMADAIIMLMDCTEITAEDEMLIQTLRRFSDKVIIAVNKVDDVVRDVLVHDFYRFGYPRVISLSSAHGIGIDVLEEELMDLMDLEELDEPEEEKLRLKIAVLGKPNTGKSTLTNALTGNDTSIVSDVPGTTRDVIMGEFSYRGTDFTILDTAGIRRKSKVEEDVEYYSVNRAIKTIDEADIVLLMIDVQTGLVEQDKKIAQLIVRRGKGIILVFNKVDTLTGIGNELEAIKDRTRFLFPILSFAPFVPISAKKGIDIDKMLDVIWSVWKQLTKRVETAQLNNFLRQWSDAYEPPRGSRGHFKVYYGTQVSANPVRFLFFVNRRKDFPEGYIKYLQNCIRRDLGFTIVPVAVDLKERRRNAPQTRL